MKYLWAKDWHRGPICRVLIVALLHLQWVQLCGCAEKRVATEDLIRPDEPLYIQSKPFNSLMEKLTLEQRIQLGQAMQMLPKLRTEDYGRYGIPPENDFTGEKKKQKPATFNEVPVKSVLEAMKAQRLDETIVSPEKLKNQLLWVSYSTFKYPFLKSNNIDYHAIVEWVATKKGVEQRKVEELSTFELEREIIKQYFKEIWDKLTPDQREKLLKNIEKETGVSIENKAGIAAMAGGGALAALGTTVIFSGFTFYTTMSVVICTVAGWFGLTLPFSVYMGASSTVALLAGPIGWAIAGGALGIGAILAAWPNVDKTAVFVMQFHVIRANAAKEAAMKAGKSQ